LFLVAFGEKWLPSVVPFQIICLSLMIRLTNNYAAAAAQARGWIWSQVWRDAVGVVLIAASVYALSPWGINGAATAVLAASIIAWLLMQHLLRKATPLAWQDLYLPQVPAIACSALLAIVLEISRRLLASTLPGVDSWMLLVWQSILALVVYLVFLRFSGFGEVEALLNETLSSVSPQLKRLIRLPT
jgi:O-antigen/teichoic acid export membrane protein